VIKRFLSFEEALGDKIKRKKQLLIYLYAKGEESNMREENICT